MKDLIELDWEGEVAAQQEHHPQLHKEMSSLVDELQEELGAKGEVTLTAYVYVGKCPLGWEIVTEEGVALYLLEEFMPVREPLTVEVIENYEDATLMLIAHLQARGFSVERG